MRSMVEGASRGIARSGSLALATSPRRGGGTIGAASDDDI
jgi:hypothetical protein